MVIGVLVRAAWPWAAEILLRLWHWCCYWRWRQHSHQDLTRQDDLPTAGEEETLPLIRRANESRGNEVQDKTRPRFRYLSPGIFVSILTIIGIAYAFGSPFAAQLSADTSGLVKSDKCGSWTLKNDAGPEATDQYDLVQADKERQATQYAADCYALRGNANRNRCKFFEHASIPYRITKNQRCPFQDLNFCPSNYAAVKFSTGRFSASLIGINSSKPPKLSRTSVCTPLDLLGNPKHFARCTTLGPRTSILFHTMGYAFKWDIAGYSVSVYESTPEPHRDYWTPRVELNREKDTYLTIMFITSCRIFYKGKCSDYIFPANLSYGPGDLEHLYINPDPRARPLTCVDWIEICTHDEKSCGPLSKENSEDAEYEYVRLALRKSNAFHAIQYGLGAALDASSKIGDFVSQKLDDAQWVIECQKLFETTLARIQFDALDIATGFGSDMGEVYQEDTPEKAQGKLCSKLKIKLPNGYKNIGEVSLAWSIFTPCLLYILHLKTRIPFDEEKKKTFHGNWMVLDVGFYGIHKCRLRRRKRSTSKSSGSMQVQLPPGPSEQLPASTTPPPGPSATSPPRTPSAGHLVTAEFASSPPPAEEPGTSQGTHPIHELLQSEDSAKHVRKSQQRRDDPSNNRNSPVSPLPGPSTDLEASNGRGRNMQNQKHDYGSC
ncbi:hypothetical protein H2200_001848 [Cladophialophora chaetospira]|uniref:Uncharacterized protein n=1 Tax=Cladophialophora chaetospira TaxID=386627 RepID=A0AA38XLR1_9EURO|nr:hypothetical protein H2200_001848 [Cladophialophora chaetospira]